MVALVELDDPRSRDLLGYQPCALNRCDAIARAVQHERRNMYRVEQRPDIDRRQRLQHRASHRRAGACPLIASPHLAHGIVVRVARREVLEQRALAPFALNLLEHALEPLGRPAVGEVLGLAEAGCRAVENERRHALRIGSGEQDRHRTPLGDAVQRSALGPGGVHHRAQVIHALLERRHLAHRIGEAGPALVPQDQAREAGQSLEALRDVGHLPVVLDVRDEPGHEH